MPMGMSFSLNSLTQEITNLILSRLSRAVDEHSLNYLVRSHSLSVLGWCIPGLSELQLRTRLLSLLAGPFQRSFVSPFLSALSALPSFLLLSFHVRECPPSTAPRESPAPSGVPAGAGG